MNNRDVSTPTNSPLVGSADRRVGLAPNPNIAAQNCLWRRALERLKGEDKPVRMCTAVSIRECKNVDARCLEAAIARQARIAEC